MEAPGIRPVQLRRAPDLSDVLRQGSAVELVRHVQAPVNQQRFPRPSALELAGDAEAQVEGIPRLIEARSEREEQLHTLQRLEVGPEHTRPGGQLRTRQLAPQHGERVDVPVRALAQHLGLQQRTEPHREEDRPRSLQLLQGEHQPPEPVADTDLAAEGERAAQPQVVRHIVERGREEDAGLRDASALRRVDERVEQRVVHGDGGAGHALVAGREERELVPRCDRHGLYRYELRRRDEG